MGQQQRPLKWQVWVVVSALWQVSTQATTEFTVNNIQKLSKINQLIMADKGPLSLALLTTLDFSQSEVHDLLPLGFDRMTHKCHPFSGTVDGKGNMIKNVKLEMTGTDQGCQGAVGLFCGLKDAVIKNLIIDSTCSFNGTISGALCGCVGSNVSVIGVQTAAEIKATQAAGGLFALFHPEPTAHKPTAPAVYNVAMHGTVVATSGKTRAYSICNIVSNAVNVVSTGIVASGIEHGDLWATCSGPEQQNTFILNCSDPRLEKD